MALALRSPEVISSIIAVDNAPVDMALNDDFTKYIKAMKEIQDANVTRSNEADKILQNYEKVEERFKVAKQMCCAANMA